MSRQASSSDLPSLGDYLQILRRRAIVVVAAVLVCALVALVYAATRTTKYEANSQVLLEQTGLGKQLSGLANGSNNELPDRYAVTQARLARVREVANAAAAQLHPLDANALLAVTSVSAQPDADLLMFKAQDSSPGRAAVIANTYAVAFTAYRTALDSKALDQLIASVGAKVAALAAAAQTKTPLYKRLNAQQQKLQTLQALQTPSAQVVSQASPGERVTSGVGKILAIGIGIGLLLGIMLAFLIDALDTRLRSPREIAGALDLPLLATVPREPGRLRGSGTSAAVDRPRSSPGDAYRALHVALDTLAREQPAQVLLLAGAEQSSDASAVVTNLGLALARAGRRVAILDLDVRRFSRSALLQLSHEERWEDPLFSSFEARVPGLPRVDPGEDQPCLHVMALEAGDSSSDYLVEHGVPLALASLRIRYQTVLVAAPPLLAYSDALAIARDVDGIVVVARANGLRREDADVLSDVLASHPTPKLGAVVYEGGSSRNYGQILQAVIARIMAMRDTRAPAPQ